jgi:uncharacterized membrane protein YqjE
MALDQIENPPEHAHSAPAGEIRNERRPVLRWFTFIVTVALLLPFAALVAIGVKTGRREYSAIGLGMVLILGLASSIVLWTIISSRSGQRHQTE